MGTLNIADRRGHIIRRLDLHGRERLTIGRSTQRDLIINDPAISRFHCMLYREAGGWCIADAGSRSGTRIDGHPAIWKRLPPGRKASIGHLLMWIEQAGCDEPRSLDLAETSSSTRSPSDSSIDGTLGRPDNAGERDAGPTSAFLTAETDFLRPADRIRDAAR
jgi:predicted component of type VI protein secretion system